MNFYTAMPLWVVMTSLIAALMIFAAGENRRITRVTVNIAAALLKLVLVSLMLRGVSLGHDFDFRLELVPGLDLHLQADALSMLLSMLSAVLWLVTTVYAIGFMETSHQRCRFFGFFCLCVTATMGVALAGNLFTFFLFFEMLTLSTWPLVVHRGTPEAIRAGNVYLGFLLGGGALVLLGIIGLHVITDTQTFTPGGFVSADDASPWLLRVLFLLLFAGMAAKAAVLPLHRWLPMAMVAPAPVSALLHAVAVVKVGAFGVVRLVYDVFGLRLTSALSMHHVIAIAAAVTIIYGSVRALGADDLKKRLAWSTVSQVSYVILGVGIGSPLATIGGIVHLVHQGLMKITLFFCAGNLAEVHGIKAVSQMDGIGRRMPWTMAAFSLAALGMIGLPPMAGFISKWYIGVGGVDAGQHWVLAVLVASTLLNAGYFLPILHRAWFVRPDEIQPRRDAPWPLLAPTLVAAIFALGCGFLAGMPLSPLQWVILIAERFYQ